MLVRIVKLHIDEKKSKEFETFFNQNKSKIISFEGCLHVELLRENETNSIYFTYSHWKHNSNLENYRNSKVFGDIWKKTKTYFNGKPEAWSLTKMNQ